MKMSKYRTPKIEEFIGGFEYQLKSTGKSGLMMFDEDGAHELDMKPHEFWYDYTVPNLDPLEYPYTTKIGELNVTFDGPMWADEDTLLMIKIQLETGQIRVKDGE